jgi:hypothetical protein
MTERSEVIDWLSPPRQGGTERRPAKCTEVSA